jgi:hypothetical protein
VLKWAVDNGCEWGKWTCAHAARGGHLEVLKWTVLRWVEKQGLGPGAWWHSWHADKCELEAEKAGHVEVAQWVRAQTELWYQ